MPYDPDDLCQDSNTSQRSSIFTVSELQAIMDGSNKTYKDYANAMSVIDPGTKISRQAI